MTEWKPQTRSAVISVLRRQPASVTEAHVNSITDEIHQILARYAIATYFGLDTSAIAVPILDSISQKKVREFVLHLQKELRCKKKLKL